jgi:hypothetical protein
MPPEEAARLSDRLCRPIGMPWACDVLRGVYERAGVLDGRMSIDVAPRVADNTKTVTEARPHGGWWLGRTR